MESNTTNSQTELADAQEISGRWSDSAWSEPREPGQHSQTSQTGDGTGASIRRATEDADSFGRKATDSTEGYLHIAKTEARAAAQTGKSYVRDAVNAAGNKIVGM
ncbi:hypothetical protein QTH97_30135 [Variovorax sp. J22R24]|uniref:hypothetical protein n=1 Tax=Variovorax gracilis TaxID=3053502 RepID=UPI0025771A23|nr:hypothetical protein [Variovorax sp. J22R24]MDM0109232.1 hypothetical protein [Variovorax sp. J22R24]